MAYLYGDGTTSTLETNYIEFLREVLDFAVAVMVADHRARACQEGASSRKEAAEAELDRLKFLSHGLTKALDEALTGNPESTTNRCAAEIRGSAGESIKKAAAQVKTLLGNEIKNIGTQVQSERQASMKALERLLLKQDLPDSVHRVNLKLQDNSSYLARLAGSAESKVEWVIDLEVPSDSLFASPLRVEKIMPTLEIKVPEKGGLVRKTMRLRAHKLTPKYITELSHAVNQTTIKMRVSAAADDSGYDLIVAQKPRVRLVQVNKGGEQSAPFEPLEEDSARLLELYATLTGEAEKLSRSRRSLVEARLDGQTLALHENPATLVSRLINRIAPIVHEIAAHSLSPKELVLKRVLSNDRREEVFAAKVDLLKKIEPVPMSLRGVFAPLGLGDLDTVVVRGPASVEGETHADPHKATQMAKRKDDQPSIITSTPVLRPPILPGANNSHRLPDTMADDEVTVTKGRAPPVPDAPATNGRRDASVDDDNSIDVALAELENEQDQGRS